MRNSQLCVAAFAACLALLSARADTTLVFNEIMYHPNAGTNEPRYEWVELYNQLAADLDVSDWRISGQMDFKFPVGTRIPGRSFIVVAYDPATLMTGTGLTNVFGPVTNRLSNSGGTLKLHNNAGRLMDSVTYGTDGDWPVAPDGSGASLAKIDRDFGSAQQSNWTFSREVGGTPGADNFGLANASRLLGIGGTWKFDASGTDLGTAWRSAGYNDAAWGSRYNLTNQPITTLYNTGIGTNGAVQANGTADPHYILTAAAQGTVGANATVIVNHPNWLANNTNSMWIGVVDPGSTSIAAGGYSFQTKFSLAGLIPATAQIRMNVAVDNDLTNTLLNGVSVGNTYSGFAAFGSAGTVSSNFVAGTNTLEFRTYNSAAGPGGFRAEVSGSAMAIATNTPLASGRSTYYFRSRFVFGGNPQFTTLTLNPIVSDGAVFYLNGVEVYRYNLPAGTISYSTAANTDVTPGYTGPITISGTNLVTGTNVLAVEVHQALASADGPVLDVDLSYSSVAAPTVGLAFNEYSPTTNAITWVELMNYGTSSVQLAGMVLRDDASGTNYEYALPAATLAPGTFIAITNLAMGFTPVSGDKLYLYSSNRYSVYDGVLVKKSGRARSPDGAGEWLVPASFTPAAPNLFNFRNELVINEIMYDHQMYPATSNAPATDNPESWIEIYNRSTNAVDLTGWEIGGGISYKFPSGKTIAAGGYLVVAKDAATLRGTYPGADIVGDFTGKLSHSDDVIKLKDPIGNPANTVHYYSSGRWPEYAAGAGSSLELRDPNSDNSAAEAWAASDESRKSVWQTYTYRMVAAPSATPTPDGQWRDFVLGLLSSGECFIDDISVIQNPTTAPLQMIDNGNFENGRTGWRFPGNHVHSQVEVDPDNAANHVLHIVAVGPQEHMNNHIETTLSSGRSVTNGNTYEISFRARWVAGNNLLNTRLYFNRCARTVALPTAILTGTPGAQNSRYVTNAGPTFAQFAHSPVVPKITQAVTVSAVVKDPQGVASCQVFYSVNGGAWSQSAMSLQNGLYAGTIPAQTAGAVVQFYVRASDALGAVSTYPAGGAQAGSLYKVDDGLINLTLTHGLRIIMSPSNTTLLHATTNVMSNELLPCTVIYDERKAYYDIGIRLKSSERGRNQAARVGFHLEFHPDDLFRGVHPVLLVDRSTGGTRPALEEIVLKHLALRAGLNEIHSDVCRIVAPQAAQNGPAIVFPRFEDEFVSATFDNGSAGTLWELELTYYPTTADAGGYKIPEPDGVQGVDISDLGAEKEAYRYNFIIKNHRSEDDYSRFINFAKIWSTNGNALDAGTRLTMDVDEFLRTYAHVSLCGVSDMYSFGNNHNFMFYLRPSDGKMLYFPWDMDFSFSRAYNTALVGDQNIAKIVNLPANLRRFYAHVLDMVNVSFNTAYANTWLSHYSTLTGTDYTSDGTYIQQRGDFAKTTIASAGGSSAFTISGVSTVTNGVNVVALSGTAPVQMTSITVNGIEYPITWSTISSWTIYVPVSAASNLLSVVGTDLHGNIVSNLTRTVYYTNAIPDPRGSVVFSEIMYNPLTPNAGYVEFFNTSSNFTFDLSGWQVNGLDFAFPNGTIISNRQYIVIAAAPATYNQTYGAAAGVPVGQYNGSLQLDGETLTLIKPAPTTNDTDLVVDRVRYESALPWPVALAGSSVQLVDSAQTTARVGNWVGAYQPMRTNDGWRQVSMTAPFGSNNRLLIYLDNAGSVILDDISLVLGSNPGVGSNYVNNGSFESPLDTNVWVLGTNMLASAITTNATHSGSGALQLVQTSAGGPSTLARDLLQTLSSTPPSGQTCTFSFWYLATNNAATNIFARIVSSTISVSNAIAVTVTPPTNVITPGAANFMATNLPAFQSLWINELQSDNVSGIIDSYGERDPWIELYNPSTNAVSLDGLYLSSNYSNLTAWAFPVGITVPAGGFKVIWCDGQPSQTSNTEAHTSFRLSASGGALALSRIYNGQPQVLDYVNYPALHTDRSFGSFPDGQPFARTEFYFVTAGGTNNGASGPLNVFINEWVASNIGLLQDPADSGFDDWFELFNPGSNAVDIAGYYLTDNLTNKFQYRITTNGPHIIPGGGYLLVWADGQTGQNTTGTGAPRPDLHVSFSLAKGGEQIGLFAADGTLIDGVTFGAQTNDVSQGRYPDGSPNIVFMPGTASPRAANYLSGGGSSNTPPHLNTIGQRSVFVGQTLAFTATATDSDLPPQALTLSLDPGAPDGANINGDGSFTWSPIGPGTYSATIRVTDNGVPPLSAFETFSINVYNPPSFAAPTRNGSTFQLSLDAVAGKTYKIQFKNNLNADTWTDVTGTNGPVIVTNTVSGTNGPVVMTNGNGKIVIEDNMNGQSQRFFRVLAQ